MTQVITFLNSDFISVATDRRFSYLKADGSFDRVHSDDNCKLVNLCMNTVISYCGLGRIDGLSTHEWIAKTLANENCRDGFTAANILKNNCEKKVREVKKRHRHTTFLICGWSLKNDYSLPYAIRVSNSYDIHNKYLEDALPYMLIGEYIWDSKPPIAMLIIGKPLRPEQSKRLNKNISRYLIKKSLPSATLRMLSDEIIKSSRYGDGSVGEKVLGATIPRPRVNPNTEKGHYFCMNTLPSLNMPTFTYFEDGFDQAKQYGPVFVCGEHYLTDVIGKKTNDGIISVEARFW